LKTLSCFKRHKLIEVLLKLQTKTLAAGEGIKTLSGVAQPGRFKTNQKKTPANVTGVFFLFFQKRFTSFFL